VSAFTVPTGGLYHLGYGEPHRASECPDGCTVAEAFQRFTPADAPVQVTYMSGVSDEERAWAQSLVVDVVVERLRETGVGPVPAPHYPDRTPRNDQDADARCPAGPGAEVPAPQVRPADLAEAERDRG
jgi:hypothetical protein